MTKDFSLHSGERLTTIDLPVIYPDVLARYEYVCADMKGRGDNLFGAHVFCGAGYGTDLMAEALDAVVLGIDGSTEAIARANEQYRKSNTIFAAKLFPFCLPRNTFDFVASLESVEHVLDYRAFCMVLCDSLKPGGRLYISAPNEEQMVLSRLNYHWHYKHFKPGELDQFVEPFGMRKIESFSTSCSVGSNGDVLAYYPYRAPGKELLAPHDGDTLFIVYEKAR
jgi:SAM-dependent methyltransferase